tara:strand:- start:733 stop:1887 length:1155 start_codon:yes stop_codon:yes gene_type:complete
MKNFFKNKLIIFFKFFIKDKKFFFINPSYLGGLLNLIYLSAKSEKVKVIVDPKYIYKKNSFINKKIFLIAYEKLNNKKFNILENLIYYIFFRLVRYTDEYKNFFVKAYVHGDAKVFEKMHNYNGITFDLNENIKDKDIRDLVNRETLIFHCRDAEYKKITSDINSSYHDYRNEDLTIYEQAISKFKKKGNYSLVRFGSVGIKKCKNREIFDYTFSKSRSQINDIHLIKNCKIYIGTGSGPDVLAMNFQKPIVFINWVHLPNLFTFQKNVVVIFKKIYSKSNNSFIKFDNLLSKNYLLSDKKTPVGLFYHSDQYKQSNLELIHNSEDEIYHAVDEMINYVNGNFEFDENLQNKFRSIYKKNMKNKINDKFFVSEYFIKKNLNLFN